MSSNEADGEDNDGSNAESSIAMSILRCLAFFKFQPEEDSNSHVRGQCHCDQSSEREEFGAALPKLVAASADVMSHEDICCRCSSLGNLLSLWSSFFFHRDGVPWSSLGFRVRTWWSTGNVSACVSQDSVRSHKGIPPHCQQDECKSTFDMIIMENKKVPQYWLGRHPNGFAHPLFSEFLKCNREFTSDILSF